MKFLKNMRMNFTAILLFCLSAAMLVGCSYSQNVQNDKVRLPEGQTADSNKIIVYSAAITHLDTMLETKLFGIGPADDGTTRVSHGLSFRLHINDLGSVPQWELDDILKRHSIGSLEQFISQLSSTTPVIPGSVFKALPKPLGKEIFDFVLTYKQDDPNDIPVGGS